MPHTQSQKFVKDDSKVMTHNSPLKPAKAKEILSHGEVRGHKLSKAQKGFFGARAGGAAVRRKGY